MIAVNTPVLLYTLVVCALTALVFGLTAALHSRTAELTIPLLPRLVAAAARQPQLLTEGEERDGVGA